jgi:autotransporter-associated beta strand protein
VSNVSFVSNSSVNPLPVSTALTVAAGATFDLNGGSQSVASLTGSGTVTNTNPGTIASLTVSNGGIFSGTIQDGVDPYGNDIPLSLTVSGGALTLTGTNTYEGGTIVSGGTLTLGNNDAIAEGSSLTVGDASLFSDLSPASAVTAQASPVTAERMSPTSVPEPGTLALLAAAIVFGVWLGHRAQLRP